MNLVQNIAAIHYPPKKFKHFIGNRKYFTFVRNPVTWYQSRWSGKFARDNHPVKLKNQPGFELADDTELNDFQFWVANVLDRTNLTKIYETYCDGCDFIGRTENLSTDLIAALTTSGETFDPKFARSTQRKNEGVALDRWYTKPLLKKVIESNHEIMDRFGYTTNWRAYSELIFQG
jgi:hypothetical protein